MNTLILTAIYMLSAGLIFAVPAFIIAIIFPNCLYEDVVASPIYVVVMAITALIIAGAIVEEVIEKAK